MNKLTDGFYTSALSTGRLHLGCGRNVMPGWTNVDYEPQPDAFRWDLVEDLPLPNACVQYIFSEHFIEHISYSEGQKLLRECKRILKPGGGLRLSTPDLAFLINQYTQGRINEWHDMGWAPSTPCAMINEGLRLWGHQYVYDQQDLHRSLALAGFSRIETVQWRKSNNATFNDLEIRPYHHEIIVEAWV
ncbi:class I SAM-dependent methyltransferase [Gluconacetobacter takamatsuzukensis]|uniref:Methyltransferase domain-containing protein n=1 Tax=Gluconacetobacter takamatsuzukensis TaxID=1286190 RepID=A0A7W4PPF4_9PROT|nr:methyltransferase domain-containing protein [Gluconacetobacter takamatsuzukensis]MBB2205163.1 methyltransferase domain-containing protein [Gluconacetobacter takamatsuzukensis]